MGCEKFKAGPISEGEISILKKKKKNLQTWHIPSEQPLQRDLGPGDGLVFIHGEALEDTLEAAISQLEQLKSSRPSARLLLPDTTGIL